MADGRLREPERLGEVADARLGAGRGRDQAEELQAGRIREYAHRVGQLRGFSPGEGRAEEPGAAALGEGLDGVHGLILTPVDGSVKISTVIDTREVRMSRVQLALNVGDLDAAVEFYGKLFRSEPAKRRPGYANFAIDQPPLKLVLIEGSQPGGTLNHLGVEVESTRAVSEATGRLADSGLETRTEDHVECCYAVQDKVWVRDPDGAPWEVYTVLADSPTARAEGCGEDCC
jgi:catechol 2,3-dioxygenase-like lactoylglutathione lyase family enzyme